MDIKVPPVSWPAIKILNIYEIQYEHNTTGCSTFSLYIQYKVRSQSFFLVVIYYFSTMHGKSFNYIFICLWCGLPFLGYIACLYLLESVSRLSILAFAFICFSCNPRLSKLFWPYNLLSSLRIVIMCFYQCNPWLKRDSLYVLRSQKICVLVGTFYFLAR